MCSEIEELFGGDKNSCICHQCWMHLNNIHKTKEKLDALKLDLVTKLGSSGKYPQFTSEQHSRDREQHSSESDREQHSCQSSAARMEDIKVITLIFNMVHANTAFIIQVTIPYQSGPKSFNVHTPRRKKLIKKIAHRSQVSLVSTVINSPTTSSTSIKEIAWRIKSEMKVMSSNEYDSIFRHAYTVESLRNFSWERIMLELRQGLPTLTQLLECLIPHPAEKKPLFCLVSSQLLKARHGKLGLVQRAVSTMLFGHSTSKQVRVSQVISNTSPPFAFSLRSWHRGFPSLRFSHAMT